MKTYRHLDTITGLFVAVLLISNIASTKILALGPFTFDGGTILFPLSYIFGDILTEVYGYGRSRKVIWIGFLTAILMSVTFALVGALPPAADWELQDAYMSILGQTPRIVLASLIAYFAGNFSNAYTLSKLKLKTRGRWLWLRTISSTLIGQLIDTGLFVAIAFAGLLPNSLLWTIVLSNYIFKCGVEVLCTPLTYAIVNWLKRQEHEDAYDTDINFNPFRLFRTN
ncbi:queuosine precursor transporter [Leptolyngbya sp. AN02str]|uniref:queuosine precursor transporter n=1 Tax=Leptolyngbya sp. AN02str TaxID=3423363 RepID=UPI003D31BF31